MTVPKAITGKKTANAYRLILSGEFTVGSSQALRDEALRAVGAHLPIVVDLSKATYLDASCLQVLKALQCSKDSNVTITVRGATAQLVDDARMLGMESVLLTLS